MKSIAFYWINDF